MDLKTWIKATARVGTAKVAAKLCNVHYQTIGNLVRGEAKGMALSTFRKIANGLGLSLEALAAMCPNLSVKGLEIAQEAEKAEPPIEPVSTAEVSTTAATAASLVAQSPPDIPAIAPVQTSSPIQAILNRAVEIENDPDSKA